MEDNAGMMSMLELPPGVHSMVISRCSGADKAVLRQTCQTLKAAVDRHLIHARWTGVPPSHASCLPPAIRKAAVFSSGPVTKEWLLQSFSQLTALKSVHLAATDAWEPAPLKEGRRPAKPEEPPGALGALPELLNLARAPPDLSCAPQTPDTAGRQLTSLTMMGVGTGVGIRRVRDRDMRLMLGRIAQQAPDAGHGLLTFASPAQLNFFRSFLQGISSQLVNLRSLYLECGFWRMCGHYATHELSRLTALTHLSFRKAEEMLVSHITPLYLITSLRSLDLTMVELQNGEEASPDPLGAWHQTQEHLDPATRAMVVSMAKLNKWGLGTPRDPVKVLLTQLGRCTNLTALNMRDMVLPWEDSRHPDEGMHEAGQLSDLLGPLSPGLRVLDLSLMDCEEQAAQWMIEGMTRLTALTRLEMDQDESDHVLHGNALVHALKEQVLPNLRHVSLSCLYMDDSMSMLEDLKALTQVTHLDLSNPHHHDDPKMVASSLHSLLDKIGRNLHHLAIGGWPCQMSLVASACPGLAFLDIANVQDIEKEMCAEQALMRNLAFAAAWDRTHMHDDVWSQLPGLQSLKCWGTSFDAGSLVSLLRHCPRLEVLEASAASINVERLADVLMPGGVSFGPPRTSSAERVRHTSLLKLYLDQQKPRRSVSERAVRALVMALPSLERLSLRDMHLDRGGWLALGLGLTGLRSLNAGNSGLTDEHLTLLALGTLPLEEVSGHSGLARLNVTPRDGQCVIFPNLIDLEVTDDRRRGGCLTRAGVDSLAASVAAGRIALRELRIYEAHAYKGFHDPANGPTEGDSDEAQTDGGPSESAWESVDEEDNVPAHTMGGPSGRGLAHRHNHGGSENIISDEEGNGSSGSGSWEEVVPGADEEVDAEAAKRVEVERRPRILEQPAAEAWLRQGLLVRNTFWQSEEEERAKHWITRKSNPSADEFEW